MSGKPDNRRRLSDLMERRRTELGLTWKEVAEAGGISYEAIRAVRHGTADLRAMTKHGIDVGLRWVSGSVQAILDGRDPAPVAPPTRPIATAIDDGQFSLFSQLPRTLVDQIWPDYLLIAGRAEAAAAAHEGLVPAGSQVFPRDAALAAQWDDLAAQVSSLGMFPSDETLIHRVAETMALAWTVARGRQGGQSAGPVAAGLDGRHRPVIHALRFRER